MIRRTYERGHDDVLTAPVRQSGNPRRMRLIVQAADDHNASLIVLGPHRRSGLLGAPAGQRGAAVITHSTTPILMVPRGVMGERLTSKPKRLQVFRTKWWPKSQRRWEGLVGPLSVTRGFHGAGPVAVPSWRGALGWSM
jgi:hypothetical protein